MNENDVNVLKQINERWENGQPSYEELENDFLWVKQKLTESAKTEQGLEISKMLTLSTAHIQPSTHQYLDENDIYGLPAYNKEEYGWFIYIDKDAIEMEHLSLDLAEVVQFAIDNGCDVLCLDCDGETVDSLPVFEY